MPAEGIEAQVKSRAKQFEPPELQVAAQSRGRSPELWGGIECTVNRVAERYLDQLTFSGHDWRISDLDAIAGLGIRTLRYPVLWERVAPHDLGSPDWTWSDARLERLRELQVAPIVGLVHHGSGPRSTNLLDDEFAAKLARYARAVAERYPWVRFFTPINEPLTTARFSCLYGHWYPHRSDSAAFARALLNQCRAVVLAMQAIREVNPEAQLVSTEDLGFTHSTAALAYQAEHENQRRWLSCDLLCGTLDESTPMWQWLLDSEIAEAEMHWFLEHPCVPNIMGFNYYLTSERFLDDRVGLYPGVPVGGNGRDRYVDMEAARVLPGGVAGHATLFKQAWERYGVPLALTEVHNGCTREEQLRWLMEAWNAACSLRAAAVDVRAVTVWALLGAHDWNSLVTEVRGHYEPGPFDLRAPQPRRTALASCAASLAKNSRFDHPVLDQPGWWHRPDRLFFNVSVESSSMHRGACEPHSISERTAKNDRPILITGASGTLGRAVSRVCASRGLAHHLLSRKQLDIASPLSVAAAIERYQPWAIVNTAGYVRVDDAEGEAQVCTRENADGPARLAEACARQAVALVTFSSDLVFDGRKTDTYVETDPVFPLNVYGYSKALAERNVLAALPGALVIRTSAFFGPWDEHNFVLHALRALRRGERFEAADDVTVSPTYVPDLVQATLELLIDGEHGIVHLANAGQVSWAELARMAARLAGLNPELVIGRAAAQLCGPALRPRFSALASERLWIMPSLENALGRFLRDCEVRILDEEEPALLPDQAAA